MLSSSNMGRRKLASAPLTLRYSLTHLPQNELCSSKPLRLNGNEIPHTQATTVIILFETSPGEHTTMSNRHQELAEKAVEVFKSKLSEQARQDISDAQFEELTNIIKEALSQELGTAVNLVEELAKNLRTEVERPELEL